jgi:hypothetical protein
MPMTPALISGPGAGAATAHADPARLIKKKRLPNIFIIPISSIG